MLRFVQKRISTNNLHKRQLPQTTYTKDNSHKQSPQKTTPTKKGRGRPGEP